ncbi:MAG TPA: hypothetical protein VE172_21765 [Stackebrandtia sp.]|jgi:hypothetical protein|uniref:hypothetical protein n=1 Tax=Stackebrandtia sp. TaxID=2023065 RepID=UPI002D593843|nr:hypothetical protein [Stackebrandtia sp.]HZE41437.1 hypothetical protein [Stackebrandtia sp.]
MRIGKRHVIQIILAVVLIGANGWGALLLWTLASPTVAVKLDTTCPDPVVDTGPNSCTGSWTNPDGTRDNGSVGGTNEDQYGQTVNAHIGPIGAWSADDPSWLLWLMLPGAVDAGVVLAAVRITAMTRLARADAARLAAEAPADGRLFRFAKDTVTFMDGRPYMALTRRSDSDVDLNTPEGLPWYAARAGNADDVVVHRENRAPAGRVSVHRQGMSPQVHFGVWNGRNELLGWMLMSDTSTARRNLVNQTGAVLGSLVIRGKNRALLWVPRDTDADTVATLLAAIAATHWLTLRVVARHLG